MSLRIVSGSSLSDSVDQNALRAATAVCRYLPTATGGGSTGLMLESAGDTIGKRFWGCRVLSSGG